MVSIATVASILKFMHFETVEQQQQCYYFCAAASSSTLALKTSKRKLAHFFFSQFPFFILFSTEKFKFYKTEVDVFCCYVFHKVWKSKWESHFSWSQGKRAPISILNISNFYYCPIELWALASWFLDGTWDTHFFCFVPFTRFARKEEINGDFGPQWFFSFSAPLLRLLLCGGRSLCRQEVKKKNWHFPLVSKRSQSWNSTCHWKI